MLYDVSNDSYSGTYRPHIRRFDAIWRANAKSGSRSPLSSLISALIQLVDNQQRHTDPEDAHGYRTHDLDTSAPKP